MVEKEKRNEEKTKEMKLMQKLGFPIALLIFIIMWFVPIPGMDEITRRTLGLMFFTVTLWVTRPVLPALSAMLFMVLAWGLKIAPFKDAFSGFTNTTTWFVWAALIIALAVKEQKLGLRLACFLATKIPASTKGMLASSYILWWLMTYLIPSSTARVASVAPISAAQVETLGIPLKSRTGKMLMTSIVTVNSYNGTLLLTGGSTVVTAWGVMKAFGVEVNWIEWWAYMIVPGLIAMAVNFIINLLIFRPEAVEIKDKVAFKEIAKGELRKLGPMSMGEKKLSLILFITIALWATESFHGLDTALVCCMCGILLCFPGVGVLKAKEAMRRINWATIVFVAAAISIGTVTESTGVASIIKDGLSFILKLGGSEYTFLLMLLVLGFFGRLVLRSGSANAAVLLLPSLILADSLGYNPLYVGMAFVMSLAGIFMYQHSYGLIAYDYGTFEEPDFILSSMARYVGLIAYITFAYFIWWPLLGI